MLSGSRRLVRLDPPVLLAPMEGITDPIFRDLVCPLGGVGGATSEFIRLTTGPLLPRTIRKHLGTHSQHGVPVAVQLMASDPTFLADSAAAGEHAGADWIDLNFGCPAPLVCGKGAGAALLCDPSRIGAMITAARSGCGVPVTAKIRAGIDHPDDLERLVLTCADAGAAAITLHARLRCQSYAVPATWAWLERGQKYLDQHGHPIPLIGNGSIERPSDVAAMRQASGCAGVMIGRSALADPWIFRQAQGGPSSSASERGQFLSRYRDQLIAQRGQAAAWPRLKQLIRWWRADPDLDQAKRTALMAGPGEGIAAWISSL